ncbi:uncharacterized protein SPSK_03681 [Sporothrix schenckii 1099-18]|uniref:Uncharacterized protein n=1 Tax=Sporothrix schenckii 1099-18 TaxID=1397361 RepID=A0A0F2LXM5_SPOSC|nr:uncharacterized protein SPSK_03681 [Sporothrix schenckii 1099-18]KJR82217.1 hypothetical protein SPSK_03681 [Sporothrix schenckii 1099-18]
MSIDTLAFVADFTRPFPSFVPAYFHGIWSTEQPQPKTQQPIRNRQRSAAATIATEATATTKPEQRVVEEDEAVKTVTQRDLIQSADSEIALGLFFRYTSPERTERQPWNITDLPTLVDAMWIHIAAGMCTEGTKYVKVGLIPPSRPE